ncbi:GNAT family N-acetyltransferase [Portibacter marinus]|uniref:GNAT family N-acetyltransferase n=1 Tax=Portibacter marinus TaxID=2898660 RepID=UPI001F194CB0|nr:GNAT family N-acetyltransferase [Portibacter marinus]
MIEALTKHDFENHRTAIQEILMEIQYVDTAKAVRIMNRIDSNFSDYKDFSLFHFTEKRLSGAIFAQRTNKFTEVGRSIKISYMAVRKEHRGMGIAKELLEYFLSNIKHSFENVVLTSYEQNERGIKFYTKFGFVPYVINRSIQYVIKDQGTSFEHRDIVFIRRFPLKNITIRPLRTSNIEFLREMIVRSFSISNELFTSSKIDENDVVRYYENWDSKKEIGYIARYEDKDIGAIWCRKLPYYNQGFGYVEDHIPEMGIGVYYEYRGRGIGQMLMDHLFTRLKHMGEYAISVFVVNDSPAKRAYLKNGFNPIRRDDNRIVMLKKL